MKKHLLCLLGCLAMTACSTTIEADNQGDAIMKSVVANMQSKEQLMAMGLNEKMAENTVRTSCEGAARATSTHSYNLEQYSPYNLKISSHTRISSDDTVHRTIQCMRALGLNITDTDIQKLKQSTQLQQNRLDKFEVRKGTF